MKEHPVLTAIDGIRKIDSKKIIRTNLGDASFKEFEPILKEVYSKLSIIEQFYEAQLKSRGALVLHGRYVK